MTRDRFSQAAARLVKAETLEELTVQVAMPGNKMKDVAGFKRKQEAPHALLS
jgi:hypothetical protein